MKSRFHSDPISFSLLAIAPFALVACGASSREIVEGDASVNDSGALMNAAPDAPNAPAAPTFDAGTWVTASPSAPTIDFLSVATTGPNDVWAAGIDGAEDGYIYHWDGASWSLAMPQSQTGFVGIWANSASDAWAVGTYPGESLYTGDVEHWNGSAWAPETNLPSTTSYLWGVWASGPADVWVAGSVLASTGGGLAAAVYHFDGTTWTVAHQNASADEFWRVWGTGPSDVWVTGRSVTEHYDGTSWTAAGPSAVAPNAGWSARANDVWAAGLDDNDAGVLLHWNGTAWSNGMPVGAGNVGSLWSSGPNGVWAVGDSQDANNTADGFVLYWNGTVWSRVTNGVGTNELNAVSGSLAQNVWAVGDKGLVLRLE